MKMPFNIQKTIFDVTLVHFLLMFGYKLFSLFYPLYLASIGLSALKIGWVYLLLYGSIAVSVIAVNFFIRRFNPAAVAAIGILGYAAYSLIMLEGGNSTLFYFAQIVLGISAAFWLVSLKVILIESRPASFSESFGWFYSAPEYASAAAPAIGAIIIWKFGFNGVFIASFFIQLLNAFYCYFKLRKENDYFSASRNPLKIFNMNDMRVKYVKILRGLKKDKVFVSAIKVAFLALVMGGVFRAFFVLYLKELNFSQEDIIKFMAILSVSFIPLSFFMIKIIGRLKNADNINLGAAVEGVAVLAIGLIGAALNIFSLFPIMIADGFGGLAVGSGKSAFFAEKLGKDKEEASAMDSILSQVGVAFGGIIGGILISGIGYKHAFVLLGAAVFVFGIYGMVFRKK